MRIQRVDLGREGCAKAFGHRVERTHLAEDPHEFFDVQRIPSGSRHDVVDLMRTDDYWRIPVPFS